MISGCRHRAVGAWQSVGAGLRRKTYLVPLKDYDATPVRPTSSPVEIPKEAMMGDVLALGVRRSGFAALASR